jgi:serpin B
MNRSKWFTGFLPAMLILAVGCEKGSTVSVHHDLDLTENSAKVVAAQNQFTFKLFKAAQKQDSTLSNKLISPLSVYLDLSMAYNGAATTTKSAMEEALQMKDVTDEDVNKTNQALITGLPREDSRVTLNIANSIWYNQRFQPLAPFLQTASDYYQAKVSGADFSNPTTVQLINNWAASQTQQKIKTILDKISTDDVMYLLNAVYFKGQWKYKFDADKTTTRTFSTADKGTVQTPFMVQKGTFGYMQNDSVQMISLPYGNGDFSMYVLLPSPKTNLQQLIAGVDENTLEKYIARLDTVSLKLWLPKWKYSYKIKNMKPELATLGMGIAFSPKDADFSDMYPPDLPVYISKVIHKTYIQVDEQGTEAAAVTAIGITYVTSAPALPVMDINRPFLYVITEKSSGVILFVGEVNNPAEH